MQVTRNIESLDSNFDKRYPLGVDRSTIDGTVSYMLGTSAKALLKYETPSILSINFGAWNKLIKHQLPETNRHFSNI
jgi:hypothetical protein